MFKKFANIKMKNKFENKKIEQLNFRYFIIRNVKIPNYRSFQILIPAHRKIRLKPVST